MKTRSLLIAGALMGFSVMASAQAVAPTFTYTSGDTVDHDYSTDATTVMHPKTQITITPYLYIKGTIGANWQVDGWGTGNDTQKEILKFYHNENLTLVMTDFADPAKTSGTTNGDQTIPLFGKVQLFKDADNTSLFDSGLIAIADLNTTFTGAGPNFDSPATAGVLRMEFSRKITIAPTAGPGIYVNTGTITVIRN